MLRFTRVVPRRLSCFVRGVMGKTLLFMCPLSYNLRSSWLFLVPNISCRSKRFLYRTIRPSRFGRFWGKLKPSPHYAGGIWKGRFSSENASNVFHSHYVKGIWKRNNYRTFCICVWAKTWSGNSRDYCDVIVLDRGPWTTHGPGPWTRPWTTPKSPLLIWKFIRDQCM